MKDLSSDDLRMELDYNPSTGVFRRRVSGEIAGGIALFRGLKYHRINVRGAQYLSHRLAWLHVHGRWPTDGIDHINGDGTDNRIANLREATQAQNLTNIGVLSTNKVGLRGVHYHPGAKRYRAMISKAGRSRHLGYFDTPEEAAAAYLAEARRIHGAFVRTPELGGH